RVARDGEFAILMSSIMGSLSRMRDASAKDLTHASLQVVNERASDLYEAKPYEGRLTLFKPNTNYDFYPDPQMGWGDLALGGLDIVELPVNPHAMLVEPYVRYLAD